MESMPGMIQAAIDMEGDYTCYWHWILCQIIDQIFD